MVKHDGEWYAHFLLKRTIEVPDKPKTLIAIDRGKHNLAVAISKSNPNKPMKGQFWSGREIKRIKRIIQLHQEKNSGASSEEG
jgi:transposase